MVQLCSTLFSKRCRVIFPQCWNPVLRFSHSYGRDVSCDTPWPRRTNLEIVFCVRNTESETRCWISWYSFRLAICLHTLFVWRSWYLQYSISDILSDARGFTLNLLAASRIKLRFTNEKNTSRGWHRPWNFKVSLPPILFKPHCKQKI